MRVLITGAAGLVGTALQRAYAKEKVLPLRHSQLDISDVDAVHREVSDFKPDVIFNCAVIGVDDCERDPQLARRVNVSGPRFLADAAADVRAALVHFSTNYVFDGDRAPEHAYTQDDVAKPVNVYGETKLQGEREVADACSRAFVVRTSWVFGREKDSFLSTAGAKLARGERIRAITDTWASTTYVEDLVARVREIVDRNEPGMYHVVNDGALSYEEFALECARLVGADPLLIDRAREADAQRPARRPRATAMRCLRLPPLRPWREALADYLT
jgi:dTDP-4-dehydrorhamnose reductase